MKVEMDLKLTCAREGYVLELTDSAIIATNYKGSETYPISKMQGISLKPASGFNYGSLSFKIGSNDKSVHIGFGVSLSGGGEKVFYFDKSQNSTADKFYDYMTNYEEIKEQRMRQPMQASSAASVVEIADGIRALKGLLDDGIITQEEFDAKKKQMLGI